jgi:hypothetical protein
VSDADAAVLAANLTKAYSYSADLVAFCVLPPQACWEVSEHPRATLLARFQASSGRGTATSLRHDRVTLDGVDAAILRRLDGEHDHVEVADAVFNELLAAEPLPAGADPAEARAQLTAAVEGRLKAFAFGGLLEA